MRTSMRLKGLKKWTYETVCKGRMMKAPGERNLITEIVRQEPQVFIGFPPARPDLTGMAAEDPINVYPSIVIMPGASEAKNPEEKRFDVYNKVHRSPEMGQTLNVSVLFAMFEPGIRLRGFVDSSGSDASIDMTKIMEGSEEGILTLVDWIDDFKEALLGIKYIPHTDLFIDEAKINYAPFTDQNYIVDKRPYYIGFVNASFNCHSDESLNGDFEKYLK